MNNEEHRNWVKARADCTPESTFKKITCAIKHDVDCFNNLSPEKRMGNGNLVAYREHAEHTVYVGYGTSDNVTMNDHVRIHMTGSKIEVHRQQSLMFYIERKWNKQELMCDLLIDETPHSLWQISQRAIYDLLFP